MNLLMIQITKHWSVILKSYFCVLDSRFFRNMDNLLLKSIADSVQELTEDEQVSIFTFRHRIGAIRLISGSLIPGSL